MLTVYLVAGEPSGDLLASRLMRALKKKTGGAVRFYGVGGETMAQEGLTSLFDSSELAVMGLMEVIPSIPRILKRISQTVQDIVDKKPDVVVTVDSWSFSARVNKALKARKTGIPQFHYVAPQVWAWKKKRAKTCGRYIDELFALLPYEPPYFEPHGLKTDFVGHPVVEGGASKGDGAAFRKEYGIAAGAPLLCVLPGSRRSETKYLLPVFQETVSRLKQKYPALRVVVPTVVTVAEKVKKAVASWNVPVTVVTGEKARYNAFAAANAALAASGTVALELAMARVPYCIAYKMNPISSFLAPLVVKGKYVNLVNILADKLIVKEFLLKNCRADWLASEVDLLLSDETYRQTQISQASQVLNLLGAGQAETPSDKVADILLAHRK